MRLRRLHVHEDVGDPGHLGPDPASHMSGNDVGGCHCEVRLDLDMQIDVILETGLPRSTLIDPDHARDARGLGADPFDQSVPGIVSISSSEASRKTRTPVAITMMPTAKPP